MVHESSVAEATMQIMQEEGTRIGNVQFYFYIQFGEN